MKKLLLLTIALALPLAQVARADNDNKKKHKRQAESAVQQGGQQSARPAMQAVRRPIRPTVQQAPRSISRTPLEAAKARSAANRAPRSAVSAPRAVSRAPRSVAPVRGQAVKSEAKLNGRDRQNTLASKQGNKGKQKVDRGNRNFNRDSFAVARTHIIRGNHNRNWWRSRYNTTFVLFGGGYYYWWNDYWYPAYGYDPYYNSYAYSEPIYGYNSLAPGQVLENVQVALRDLGYDPGPIDGLIGPQTRAALAAFQRDNGLVVTEAVDEPTLVTLGLA